MNSVSKERKNSDNRKKKDKSKGKSSGNSSSDDDELDKIKKHSRKRTWYSSDELSSSESDRDEKKQRRKGKKKRDDSSSDYSGERSKRKTRFRSGKKEYTSEEASPSSDGSDCEGKRQKSRRNDGSRKDNVKGEFIDAARKEMGLDWMLRSESKRPAVSETKEILAEEVPVEEVCVSTKFCFSSVPLQLLKCLACLSGSISILFFCPQRNCHCFLLLFLFLHFTKNSIFCSQKSFGDIIKPFLTSSENDREEAKDKIIGKEGKEKLLFFLTYVITTHH